MRRGNDSGSAICHESGGTYRQARRRWEDFASLTGRHVSPGRVGVFRGFCVQLAGGLVGSRACPGWENSGDRHSGVIWGIRTASLGRELEPAFGLQEGYLHGGWRRMIFSSYGGQSASPLEY